MIAADIGDTVDLPVRAYEFDSIVSAQFTLACWPPNALDFLGVTPGNWPIDATNFNLAGDRLRFSWFDGSLPAGVSLPDSTVLFTMHLKVNDVNLSQHLVLLDDSPQYTVTEVVSLSMPSGPIPVTYEIGNVWTFSIVPYDMQLRNTCITGASACNAADAAISVEAAGGIPPYTYGWTGPDGFTAATPNLNNLKPGIYYLTVSDQISSATSGVFKVPQPGQPVAFMPQVTPASCAQNDACIALNSTTGQAPLAYNWLPAQSNTNQICGLSPGTYFVTVTGADGCYAVDSITVSAQNNLDVHILASHPVCGTGQLGTAAAFALNGIAPYTYLWSNGSANPVVSDLYAGPLALTVTDAAGCMGSDYITIEDPGVQSWGLELVPHCPSPGNPVGNVLLRAEDPSGIAFPLNLYWSNGTWTTVTAASGDTLDILLAAPSGLYQVTAVDSLGCSQF